MDTSCRLSSPTQILAICQNIYERMYTCASQWLNGNSCQGQHQTALTAGHFGNSLWVTLSVCGDFKRSTVVGWSPATHLIVGVLRYVRVSSFGSIRLGTAMVRVRRSLHTMLMTNSNFEPVSTGCLLLTVLCSYHHLITIIITTSPVSTCSYIHLKVRGKFSQRSKESNVQRKILRQKEESTK